jgi:hypothetical protein
LDERRRAGSSKAGIPTVSIDRSNAGDVLRMQGMSHGGGGGGTRADHRCVPVERASLERK